MMERDIQGIMMAAVEQSRKDAAFRRYVDYAANEAMAQAERVHSEVDRRDLLHVASLAAATALKMAFDADYEIQRLTQERDTYKKMVELAPMPFTILSQEDGKLIE